MALVRYHLPLVLSVGLACSAKPQVLDLRRAEAYEKRGDTDKALAAYRDAQHSCQKVSNDRRRRENCMAAHMQYAQLLVTLERFDDAMQAFAVAEEALSPHSESVARARYGRAEILRRQGSESDAYDMYWDIVSEFPNQPFAADSMKALVTIGRIRDPAKLRTTLIENVDILDKTQIADNLHWFLAVLAEEEFDDDREALAQYDALVKDHKSSGMLDDARWHGARLARKLGDSAGAVDRLKKLLATREVAFGAGSYFSVWLDNAQLELGIVLRDDVRDHTGALRAFAQLPEDYPASILKDDALFESAVTHNAQGNTEAACNVLATLRRKYPQSPYELNKAPALRRSLGCPQ